MVGGRHGSRHSELWTQREQNRDEDKSGRENPQSTQLAVAVQGEEERDGDSSSVSGSLTMLLHINMSPIRSLLLDRRGDSLGSLLKIQIARSYPQIGKVEKDQKCIFKIFFIFK